VCVAGEFELTVNFFSAVNSSISTNDRREPCRVPASITGSPSVRWRVHGILTQGWSTLRLRGRHHRCALPAHRYVLLHSSYNATDAHSPTYQIALMLDRLISINDRIPLSPCVSLSVRSWSTNSSHHSLCLFSVRVHAHAQLLIVDPNPIIPYNSTPFRESISRFHSASVPQISILEYLRRIVRFTNVEVCLVLPSSPFPPTVLPFPSLVTDKQTTKLIRKRCLHILHICAYLTLPTSLYIYHPNLLRDAMRHQR
jgi:Cyclin